MEFLIEFWLPILLSAVFVFIVSSILHMFIPIHKGDYKKLPGEEAVLAEMRAQGVKKDAYMFPCAGSMKEMSSPEMIEKYNQGPVGFMTVIADGCPNIGKSLVQWFIYSLVISVFVAYIANITLKPGADYLMVFRITGTVAILGYAVSYIQDAIWKGQKWSTTLKFIFDGVVYALVTAGTFAWLWPKVV